MQKNVSVAGFWDACKNCQLLRPDQVEKLSGSFHQEDSMELAKELIRQGHLTAYQGKKILTGRGDDLLFGQYIILDRLGAGSMGEVFKARHKMMGRIIAMKVLRADLVQNDRALQRFFREARATGKLSHPNIVNLHDSGEHNGTPFLAMEFVPGKDLASVLSESGPLSPQIACDYIRQAALGLQHAFENGITHRDLKPSNLLLTSEGVVKILDMGLARLEETEEGGPDYRLTRQGVCIGTPDYIAPEQVSDSHGADVRADIYSLGCTLYHFLAGEPPFKGMTLAMKLVSHQTTEPKPIESFRKDVPPPVAAVLRKMMAKKVNDRYQTPQEVADALAPLCGASKAPDPKVIEQRSSLVKRPSSVDLEPTGAYQPPSGPQATPREAAHITVDSSAVDAGPLPAQQPRMEGPVWQQPVVILGLAGIFALMTVLLFLIYVFKR